MEPRLTLITLGVTNLAASTQFYEQNFGWRRLPASNEGIVFFQLNGMQLALFPDRELAADAGVAADNRGFKSFSLAHNLRSEQEVDKLIRELENKGVTIVKRPQKVFWGGYSSYVSDPDGFLWEIAFNPFLPLDEKGNVVS
ncbi:glyoxalase [Adhaeribacter arboris]|uniref:Glyoxalase n=1 Tax=Adhaeribacter arboris TaxID=2072846 RepID=A0A2T2YL77_9BACT|nr:VOC family protein [Adhaeribacter arboris]PSR56264.1 glyoxalase [Adhaeribacter arboris]